MKVSMPPVELNPSSDSPLPSWKIQTSTPREAPREITFMINRALIGISTDPVSEEQQHEGRQDDHGQRGRCVLGPGTG